MKDRIVLVTGASRGIGRATFAALAVEGAHVIATARTRDALRGLDREAEANGGKATLIACEMGDAQAIDALCMEIAKRFDRLDGLFGNAGILGPKQPVAALEPREFEQAMAINVLANFRLLHHLDPLLRASDAGRALFVTSGVAWKRYAGWTPYATTKAALEAMVGVYANEVEGTSVRANLISPGPIRTEMRTEAWPDENPDDVPTPEALAPTIVSMLRPGFTANGVILDFKTRQLTRGRKPA